MLRRVLLHISVIAIATTGVIVACHNEVPGPTTPVPAPEVTRGAPKPQPIDPVKKRPLGTRKPRPTGVAQAPPVDGGVGDAVDLPPVVDAQIAVISDAATPLK